jgi:hypothetical protein
MPANRSRPVYAKYIEHVPPDTTAGIFWMKNRDPQHWRGSQQLEHVLGKYIISDKPMSEAEWARERADVITGLGSSDLVRQRKPGDETIEKFPVAGQGEFAGCLGVGDRTATIDDRRERRRITHYC